MSKASSRKHFKGFSLVEVAVAVAMIAAIAALAVPSLRAMARGARLDSAARTMVRDFQQARQMVLSGKQDFAGWTADQRTRHAGLRFVTPLQYEVFVDRDVEINGGATEVVVEVRNLVQPVEIINAPAEVRFRRNGTLSQGPGDVQVVIRDNDTGRQRTIRVAFGGRAEIWR